MGVPQMGIEQGRGRRLSGLSPGWNWFGARVLLGLMSAILLVQVPAANAATNQNRATPAMSRLQTRQQVRLVGVLLDANGGSPAGLKVGTAYAYQVDVIPIHQDLSLSGSSHTAPPQTNPRLVFRFLGLTRWAKLGTPRGRLGQSFCRHAYRARRVRLDNGQMAIDFGPCSVVRLSFIPTRPARQHFTVEAEAVTIGHGAYRFAGRQGNPLTWSGTVRP